MQEAPVPIRGLANNLLYGTTRIVTHDADGRESIGTGFLMCYQHEPGWILPVLITNKHVVSGAVSGSMIVHEALEGDCRPRQPSGRFHTGTLERFPERWIDHPNPDVDLCGMPLSNVFYFLDEQESPMFMTRIDEDSIPSEELLREAWALQDVLMVGYPNGLWDEVHGLPIMRKGITATHPGIDFQGKPWGVIDIAAFPGSSGSPIVVLNGTLDGVVGTPPRTSAILLGVLFAGPRINANGQIVIAEIPTSAVPYVSTPVMMHLGYYVKARELLVLKEEILERMPMETDEHHG